MSVPWFVYILECGDGSLYTGVALDVRARVQEHANGKGARYTRGRGPINLRAKARCSTHGDALRVEYAIKQLSRTEKDDLVGKPHRLRAFVRRHLRAIESGPKKKP